MGVGLLGSDAAPLRAGDEPGPDEERLHHALDGLRFLADRDRKRTNADRSPAEAIDECLQDCPVEPIEAKRIHVVHEQRVLDSPKITVHWNREVVDVLGGDRVVGVRLQDTVTGAQEDLAVTGVFLAIGHNPNSPIFKGQLEMDEAGYLQTIPGSAATRVPGVFACGDVADKVYRQAVTAAGTGCMAAIDAERWLAEHA